MMSYNNGINIQNSMDVYCGCGIYHSFKICDYNIVYLSDQPQKLMYKLYVKIRLFFKYDQ